MKKMNSTKEKETGKIWKRNMCENFALDVMEIAQLNLKKIKLGPFKFKKLNMKPKRQHY